MTEAETLELVRGALDESARVKLAMREMAPAVARAAGRMAEAFRAGNRLYACGNGGSACDAMHLVEELVARYKRDRPGLPAHHLLEQRLRVRHRLQPAGAGDGARRRRAGGH